MKYLGSLERCIICPQNADYANNPLTRDHIIPIKAGKDHKLILGSVIKIDENFARLCSKDHQSIDRRKLSVYRQGGLIGLIDFIAHGYPRSNDPEIKFLQNEQFLRLFVMFQTSLTLLNGQTPDSLRELYIGASIRLDEIILGFQNEVAP
jgi:hypothetical protein